MTLSLNDIKQLDIYLLLGELRRGLPGTESSRRRLGGVCGGVAKAVMESRRDVGGVLGGVRGGVLAGLPPPEPEAASRLSRRGDAVGSGLRGGDE